MQLILSTIVLSSMYALLGAGFVITYKASRLLNFAFADIALVIGYMAVSFVAIIGGPKILPIILILLFSFLFGWIIYGLLIKHMIGEPITATIMLTVALGIILNAITILIWKGQMETLRLGWRAIYSFSGGLRVNNTEIITFIASITILSGLGIFYKFTRIGRQMRATSENVLLSSQRGMNIFFITGIAWGVSVFVIGVAGILFGANYGVSLHMHNMALIGLSVALVGGLDSLGGVIPGAIIIALSQKLAASYINPRLSETIPFMFMLIVLIVKPWGLLGTEEEIERV